MAAVDRLCISRLINPPRLWDQPSAQRMSYSIDLLVVSIPCPPVLDLDARRMHDLSDEMYRQMCLVRSAGGYEQLALDSDLMVSDEIVASLYVAQCTASASSRGRASAMVGSAPLIRPLMAMFVVQCAEHLLTGRCEVDVHQLGVLLLRVIDG